jgi:hypothetical protein
MSEAIDTGERSWSRMTIEEVKDTPVPCSSILGALAMLVWALWDVCVLWYDRYFKSHSKELR